MGFTNRPNSSIRDFWPDDTEDTFYLFGAYSFEDIWQKSEEYFGEDVNIANLLIGAEHIHLYCVDYDLHDSSDYGTFTVVRLVK